MADWQTTIDFSSFLDEEMPVQCKGKAAAEILRKKIEELKQNELFDECALDELADIANRFELINSDHDEFISIDDFNYIFDDLYDWGDYPLDDNWGFDAKKRAWIKTNEYL